MLELGKRSLLLEAVSIACNNLACVAKSAAREEAQQKVVNLIALKTPEQEGEAKVPEETDLQNLQKEALCLTTIINGIREEEQQKVKNLIALKTPEQEGDVKVPEEESKAKSMATINNTRKEEQQNNKNLIALKTHK